MDPEYQRKKDKIKQDVEGATEKVDESEHKLRDVRNLTEEDLKQVQDQKERLRKLHVFFNKMPESSHYNPSPEIHEHMDTLSNLMDSYVQNANRQLETINNALWHMRGTYASTTVASGTIATSGTVIISIGREISQSFPQMREVLRVYNEPTENEKRTDVQQQIMNIDSLLADKFKEAFKTFSDGNYMSAAHAMRDVLSGFAHKLGPNEKVTNVPWYKKEPKTNGPTQRQRFKYAIIGKSSDNVIGEKEIEAVDRLANVGREIYEKLSSEAHRREGRWDPEKVRQYLSIGQNVIEEILLLRKKFFKESD